MPQCAPKGSGFSFSTIGPSAKIELRYVWSRHEVLSSSLRTGLKTAGFPESGDRAGTSSPSQQLLPPQAVDKERNVHELVTKESLHLKGENDWTSRGYCCTWLHNLGSFLCNAEPMAAVALVFHRRTVAGVLGWRPFRLG